MKDTCALAILMIVAATLAVDAQQSRRPLSPAGSSATQIGGTTSTAVKDMSAASGSRSPMVVRSRGAGTCSAPTTSWSFSTTAPPFGEPART